MLPKPTLTFTIPSIHDDLTLDCRVYLPDEYFPYEKRGSGSAGRSESSGEFETGGRDDDGNGAYLVADGERLERRKKAVILAHPYAPLGGSYDDPVVGEAGEVLLRRGFVVGCFNFRGAYGSRGHTSWTGKPELGDYISFVGFMACFLHYLYPPPLSLQPSVSLHGRCVLSAASDMDDFSLSPIPSQIVTERFVHRTALPASPRHLSRDGSAFDILGSAPGDDSRELLLVLGGYSYGSLITAHLPPLSILLSPFSAPELGSAASEIRLRGQNLAETQNALLLAYSKPNSPVKSPRKSVILDGRKGRESLSAIRMGGEETHKDVRRASYEAHHRKSMAVVGEEVRRSVERVRSLGRRRSGESKRHSSMSGENGNGSPRKGHDPFWPGASEHSHETPTASEPKDTASNALEHMVPLQFEDFNAAYLLISPLQGWIGNLATMFSSPTISFPALHSSPIQWRRKSSPFHHLAQDGPERLPAEQKLIDNNTLAIFGTEDVFSNIRKLRTWTESLRMPQKSRFRAVEVPSGGHFWFGGGENGEVHLEMLREEVGSWANGL